MNTTQNCAKIHLPAHKYNVRILAIHYGLIYSCCKHATMLDDKYHTKHGMMVILVKEKLTRAVIHNGC